MAAAPMATTHTVLTTWAQGPDSQANTTKTAMARTARSEPLNHHLHPFCWVCTVSSQTHRYAHTQLHTERETSMREKKCKDETQSCAYPYAFLFRLGLCCLQHIHTLTALAAGVDDGLNVVRCWDQRFVGGRFTQRCSHGTSFAMICNVWFQSLFAQKNRKVLQSATAMLLLSYIKTQNSRPLRLMFFHNVCVEKVEHILKHCGEINRLPSPCCLCDGFRTELGCEHRRSCIQFPQPESGRLQGCPQGRFVIGFLGHVLHQQEASWAVTFPNMIYDEVLVWCSQTEKVKFFRLRYGTRG